MKNKELNYHKNRAIASPNGSSLTIQYATSKHVELINIPEIYPRAIQSMFGYWSLQNTFYYKVGPITLAWTSKYEWVEHVGCSWYHNTCIPIPIACLTPCFQKCLYKLKSKKLSTLALYNKNGKKK